MNCIKSERVRAGMNQQELGERVGVTRKTVVLWERGDVIPPTKKLIAMADMFGCSTDYLLGRCNERLIPM